MKRIRIDRDLSLGLVGLSLTAVGAALVFAPAGLIVAGLGVLAYVVFLSPDSSGGPPS